MTSIGTQRSSGEGLRERSSATLADAAVLVVDDEPGMRSFLKRSLEKRCAVVELAASAEEAEALRTRCYFDLMVVDNRLPGRSGLEWVTELRERDVRTDVILITAYAELDTAIAALRVGVADFILKPFRVEQILGSIERCLERRRLARENFVLRRETAEVGLDGIVGVSRAMRDVVDTVRHVAPTVSTVLIEGETGTGKELVARALHRSSARDGAFVPVNCGSISPELFESELFGHLKGAFTGAHSTREGLFSYAQGGTLFLDEIGEMPLAMQSKLLRALEEKAIRPVGSDRYIPVEVRVVAATNHELSKDVAAGRFREDLFYRLNVMVIAIPPLRDRTEDIPALTDHLLSDLSAELGIDSISLTHDEVVSLSRYRWPGNVRELRNVIERALLLGRFPEEYFGDGLVVEMWGEPDVARSGTSLDWSLAEMEKFHIQRVVEASNGNKSHAARRLGVSRKTLERKLKAWKLQT